MKTAIDIAKLLAYVTLIVLLGECAFAVHRLRPQAEATLTDVRRTVVIVAGAATNVEQGAREWKKASQEQAKNSTDAIIELKRTLASVRISVNHTDASLTTLLTAGQEAIDTQSQSFSQTQMQLRESLVAMNQATIDLQNVLGDADKIVSSPELQKSLASLAESSQHTSEATAHLAATTKDVEIVAEKFKDDFVKPKNRAWAYFKTILDLGSKAKILF